MRLLQIGELFAMPLQSAIRAQCLAAQETISFIEQFGLEEGTARNFRFKAERTVEERTVDPETGTAATKFKTRPFEVSIPLLAIISPPSVQLQEINVEFAVEVVEPKSAPLGSAAVPSTVGGSSLASSLSLLTPLGQPSPTTMKVSMKIVHETPEGMARLGDLLTDLLSGRTPSVRTPLPIEKIRGIGAETAGLLRAKGILTVEDLVLSTETADAVRELANTVGVSEKRVREWREQSELLMEKEE